MATKRLYRTDRYLTTNKSTVTAVREKNGFDLITTAESYFYPEGGGQPSDTGKVWLGNVSYAVTHASCEDLESDVWHLTDTGAEWAWDGSTWQELGTAIDLSGYATKATTLAGYGITDAKIQNGTITLGSNTITPLTSYTETDPTVPSWAKQVSKPSYTASEVGALPDDTSIPSKTSDLVNDSGFITGVTSTSTPTASTIAEFDSSSYMNSTDMTSQEVDDFVDGLNPHGGEYDSGVVTVYGNYCQYRRIGHTVHIWGTSSNGWSIASGAYRDLTTLPQEARPSADFTIPCTALGGTAQILCNIKSNGIVSMYTNSTTAYWSFSTSYVVS
jgi:hypothetical protein